MQPSKAQIALLVGFAVGVVSIVPGIDLFVCCLFAPAGGYAAIYLYNKTRPGEPIDGKTAATLGVSSGLYAALVAWIVELTLTYFFRANEFIEALPEMERAMSELALGPAFDQSVKAIQEMAREMERDGFSPLYAFVLLVNNAVVFVVFTLVGALIGRSRFEKKRNALG